jgi:hypothetical protein
MAHWRRLDPALRAKLRQALGGKSAIIGRQVLDLARTLCTRGAYDLALAFYEGLDGTPSTPYQGCGLGLLMALRECIGKEYGPDPGGTILVRL